MKKLLLTVLLTVVGKISLAQVSFTGNPQYGRMQNFVYDKTIDNRIYATTNVDKHILVSADNGSTWNVLYTLPYPTEAPNIKEMRLINNGTALSFIEDFGPSGNSKVTVLSLGNLQIIKQFNLPPGETDAIGNYSIYDDGNMNTALMIVMQSVGSPVPQNRKLYRTTDGGANWINVYDSGDLELSDATMNPQNPQILYIARGSGPQPVQGGFLTSTDAGATWTETLNNIILESIAVDPQDPSVIYAGTSHFVPGTMPNMHQAVYKTTDGAASWTEQVGIDWSSNDPLGTLRMVKLMVDPNSHNHVLAMGAHKIAVTTNGGNTWTTTFHNGLDDGTSYFYPHGAAFNPQNTNQVLIANERFPKISTDGGITLTTVPNPFFTNMGSLYTLKDQNNQDQLIYGVQWGYTVRNLNTNQENPTTVYPLGTFPYGQTMAPFFFDKNIAGRAYIFDPTVFPRAIKITNDYGATTTKVTDTYDNLLTAAETDPQHPTIAWFATYNGSTPLTKIDFTNLSSPVISDLNFPTYPYDYAITGIKMNPGNSESAMVTIGNSIFKTTNGGINWTETTVPGLDLPNYINSIAQNPLNNNQYAIATTNGIYSSTDFGTTWSKIYNGPITKVEYSTVQNGQIVGIAATTTDSPSKIIYSNNAGAVWQEKNSSDYFDTVIRDGAVRFINDTTAEVYLSTYSLGVLKDIISFSSLQTSDPQIRKEDIAVYPNPATDVIHIKTGKNKARFKVSFYNAAGQMVLHSENNESIPISTLEKGIYLLKIEQENASTFIKKIIKK